MNSLRRRGRKCGFERHLLVLCLLQPTASQNKLEKYLREQETNPLLQRLPTRTNRRWTRCISHKWTTCWYVFWDDVYARNSGMKKYLKCEDFDPLSPTCICYMPRMERGDFEDWLAKRELLRRWRLLSNVDKNAIRQDGCLREESGGRPRGEGEKFHEKRRYQTPQTIAEESVSVHEKA
ncbi:hypothetical protein GQ600_8751 [Phytophthora cactorum]|nr:hypothetical protein GQ600_8751 [Phytophthora cactorum]